MGALAVGTLTILDDWVGDITAFLWVLGGFWFPFLSGLLLGPLAKRPTGRAIGAAIGAVVVLLPSVSYVIIKNPDINELRLPLLWALFVPLALAQGAMAIPVAARGKS
jgi:hypothetical protein